MLVEFYARELLAQQQALHAAQGGLSSPQSAGEGGMYMRSGAAGSGGSRGTVPAPAQGQVSSTAGTS